MCMPVSMRVFVCVCVCVYIISDSQRQWGVYENCETLINLFNLARGGLTTLSGLAVAHSVNGCLNSQILSISCGLINSANFISHNSVPFFPGISVISIPINEV